MEDDKARRATRQDPSEERRHLGINTVEAPNIGILFLDLDDVKMDWVWAGRGRARPIRHLDG